MINRFLTDRKEKELKEKGADLEKNH